jgi:hypothetical protein
LLLLLLLVTLQLPWLFALQPALPEQQQQLCCKPHLHLQKRHLLLLLLLLVVLAKQLQEVVLCLGLQLRRLPHFQQQPMLLVPDCQLCCLLLPVVLQVHYSLGFATAAAAAVQFVVVLAAPCQAVGMPAMCQLLPLEAAATAAAGYLMLLLLQAQASNAYPLSQLTLHLQD